MKKRREMEKERNKKKKKKNKQIFIQKETFSPLSRLITTDNDDVFDSIKSIDRERPEPGSTDESSTRAD